MSDWAGAAPCVFDKINVVWRLSVVLHCSLQVLAGEPAVQVQACQWAPLLQVTPVSQGLYIYQGHMCTGGKLGDAVLQPAAMCMQAALTAVCAPCRETASGSSAPGNLRGSGTGHTVEHKWHLCSVPACFGAALWCSLLWQCRPAWPRHRFALRSGRCTIIVCLRWARHLLPLADCLICLLGHTLAV